MPFVFAGGVSNVAYPVALTSVHLLRLRGASASTVADRRSDGLHLSGHGSGRAFTLGAQRLLRRDRRSGRAEALP